VLISSAALAGAVAVPQLRTVFETVPLTQAQMFAALGFSAAVPVLCGVAEAVSNKKKE